MGVLLGTPTCIGYPLGVITTEFSSSFAQHGGCAAEGPSGEIWFAGVYEGVGTPLDDLVHVRRFNGGQWVEIGNANVVSGGETDNKVYGHTIQLVVNKDGECMVIWQTYDTNPTGATLRICYRLYDATGATISSGIAVTDAEVPADHATGGGTHLRAEYATSNFILIYADDSRTTGELFIGKKTYTRSTNTWGFPVYIWDPIPNFALSVGATTIMEGCRITYEESANRYHFLAAFKWDRPGATGFIAGMYYGNSDSAISAELIQDYFSDATNVWYLHELPTRDSAGLVVNPANGDVYVAFQEYRRKYNGTSKAVTRHSWPVVWKRRASNSWAKLGYAVEGQTYDPYNVCFPTPGDIWIDSGGTVYLLSEQMHDEVGAFTFTRALVQIVGDSISDPISIPQPGTVPTSADFYSYLLAVFVRPYMASPKVINLLSIMFAAELDNGASWEIQVFSMQAPPCENNAMLVYDRVAGGAWNKWKGSGTRPLNPLVMLGLDSIKDEGEILVPSFISGDGSYLDYFDDSGVDDIDSLVAMLWTSGPLDCGAPDVIKQFRYLGFRVSALPGGSSLTVLWSVDGGVATGTVTINQVGRPMVSLPQECQGFRLTLIIQNTAPLADLGSPVLHGVQVGWYPRRQAFLGR